MIEPVALYANVSLTNGQSVGMDVRKLTPPGNRPMLVKDILFTIRANTASVGGIQLGTVIRARIRNGRFDMSNAPIPLWLHGTVPDALSESIDTYGVAQPQIGGAFYGFSRYRWVLPKPMYVPPGASIQPTFFRDDSIVTFPGGITSLTVVTVQMSVRGLLLDKAMHSSIVPFIGAFVPVTGQMQSREDDLRNTLNVPWNTHRLMGRVASSGAQPGGASGVTDGLAPLGFSAVDARPYRNQVKIDDNNGLAITNGFVPMCSVFPAQGRNWTFVRTMNVGDQLRITLADLPTTNAWPMVALIGSREEHV